MYKKFILLAMVLLHILTSNAQQSSSVKLKIEGGILWDAVERKAYLSGPFFNLEPKLNIAKNMMLGLMLEGAINTQRILNAATNQYYIQNELGNNGIKSIGPTLDFYLKTTNSRPYFGVGIIHSFLTTTKKAFAINNAFDEQKLYVDHQIGVLLRTGLNLNKVKIGQSDLSRLILGMRFTFIPKADVELSNGQKIGTMVNSNLALSVGYMFGAVIDHK